MIHRGNRVLPYLGLGGNERAKVARPRAHVAMRQLEPSLGEGVRQLLRMVVEALRDGRIDRVQLQSEVRGEHPGSTAFGGIVRIGNGTIRRAVLGSPLVRTGWALHQLPLILVQIFQEVVAPLHWRGGPYHLDAAGDRIGAYAAAIGIFPTQALLLDGRTLRFGADKFARIGSAMGLAERVPAGNERNGFLVI